MKKIVFAAAVILSAAVFASCASSDVKSGAASAMNDVPFSESRAEKPAQKKLYKGEGLVIAVLPPGFSGASQSEQWMPQYFQDSITSKFASFSKMTVLDRKNESLAVAEQERSESGFYSEENAVQIGKMTNANLVAAGNVQKIAGDYELNFRVNDTETNEIKAAFNSRYSLSQMQDGTAVNETAAALLEGLGIELSESERAKLAQTNKTENNSSMNLAKGNIAEQNGNYIDALLLYSEVPGAKATENIHKLFNGTVDTTNIQARISYYNKQKEKWNVIFSQLRDYMSENAAFIVYDFSDVKDSINMNLNKVSFTITPGVKCVPNEAAMKVWATVMKEWRSIVLDKDNDAWSKTVSARHFFSREDGRIYYNLQYEYTVSVGLFDDDNYPLKTKEETVQFWWSSTEYNYKDNFNTMIAKSQSKYLSEAKYSRIYFDYIDFADLNNGMKVKIVDVKPSDGYKKPLGIYEISEFQQKVLAQKN